MYVSYDIVGVVPETREKIEDIKREDKLRYAELKQLVGESDKCEQNNGCWWL